LRDDLIALLYDDGDPAERSRAREHLAQCIPCRTEYSELKGVRKALGGWSLPLATPIGKSPGAPRWITAGLAAAAGLVLGLGVAVAGRNAFFPVSSAPSSVASGATNGTSNGTPSFVSHDELQQMLRLQETRHQAEIAELRQSLTQVADTSAPAGAALKTVSNLSPSTIERLLKASEERQARMFEARLSGLRTESDLQRQYDMAQIAAGLAYIDSRTGADAARTSELMKNLVRVTAKPQDR
jgi:hypothetical protein